MAYLNTYRRPLLLLALTLLLGFLAQRGMTQGFDQQLFPLLALREGQSPAWLIALTQWISWIGGGTQRYIVVIVAGLILWRWRNWQWGAAMVGASALSNLASNGLKALFDRPRPSFVPHLDHVDSASFPSGHATSAAAVYLLLIWALPPHHRKIWQWPLLLLFVATGLSRPMLGVHYPSDVIGGWMLGAAFAIAAYRLVQSTERASLS